MPEGNELIPKDVLKKVDSLSSFLPSEMKKNLNVIKNAERSFSIPVKVDDYYVIIAGIVVREPIPSQLLFDSTDLELVVKGIKKAYARLGLDPNKEISRLLEDGKNE